MTDLRSSERIATAVPRRMTLRRRWRRMRQHPDFQNRVVRTMQLGFLATLLVTTSALVYRAMTVV